MGGGREKEGLGSLRRARCQAFCCRAAGAWGERAHSCTVSTRGQPDTDFCLMPTSHPLPAKTQGFLPCLLNILCLLGSKAWAEPGFFPSPNTFALRSLKGGLGWPQDATRLNGDALPAMGPHLQTTLPAFPGMVTTTTP